MHNKKFFYLTLIPALIIFCVQMCLINDNTRDVFTDIESLEGISYNYETQSEKLLVELELTRGTPNEDIIVLYNSREITRFTQKKLVIPIDCDGVFQIRNNTSEKLKVNAKSEKAESVAVKTHDIPVGITTFCFVDV